MILDTLTEINDRIAEQLTSDKVEVSGILVPYHAQTESAISLKIADSQKPFSMNSKLVFQSGHLTDGSSITDQQTFGSFTDTIHDVRFVLVGLSLSKTGIDVAYRALDGVGYVVIDSLEVDSLSVLTRYFRVRPGQAKNYDPALYAFAIRYHIEGVCDEDFAELPDTTELALLPVAVPDIHPEDREFYSKSEIDALQFAQAATDAELSLGISQNADALTALQSAVAGKANAADVELGILAFATYALAVAGLSGRTKPARVLIDHDEVNNGGNFGKYDYNGSALIEDVL